MEEFSEQSSPHFEQMKLESKIKSGASWFLWIAVLSLINSITYLGFESDMTFIIGLGVSQVVDSFGLDMGGNARWIAGGIDIVIILLFVFFYLFAKKKNSWAFIIGMTIYALDSLIFLAVRDYLSIGFHIFALYGLYAGFAANRKLNKVLSADTQAA